MRLDTDDNKIDVRSGDSTARENLHVPNRVEARASYLALAASFFSMFCVVGLALWGLPFYYDFMVREFGWTRAQVTSGNALSKLVVGPVFGFIAGWVVDRFGPRRLMIVGILVAGLALVGLGSISTLSWFYFFYLLNALGYVCGGPLPSQVLISQRFVASRGKAMGLAYLGIGFGGAAVPWITSFLYTRLGWQGSLRVLGVIMIVIALPFALAVKETPRTESDHPSATSAEVKSAFKTLSLWLLIRQHVLDRGRQRSAAQS